MKMTLQAALIVVSVVVCMSACSSDPRCVWPDEPSLALPSKNALQRHLKTDAEAAERIAVQFSEMSVQFGENGERLRRKEECEAVLSESIARVHRVTPQQVRDALRRQNDMPF